MASGAVPSRHAAVRSAGERLGPLRRQGLTAGGTRGSRRPRHLSPEQLRETDKGRSAKVSAHRFDRGPCRRSGEVARLGPWMVGPSSGSRLRLTKRVPAPFASLTSGYMARCASRVGTLERYMKALEGCPSGLETSEKLVVVGVGANPEPDPGILVANGERSIAKRDASGKDGSRRVDLLETEPRMRRVLSEGAIRLSSSNLNAGWKPVEALPEGGSSGRLQSSSGSSDRVLPARCSARAASAKPVSFS